MSKIGLYVLIHVNYGKILAFYLTFRLVLFKSTFNKANFNKSDESQWNVE